MTSAAAIYFGRTVHVREHPFRRAFSYKVALLDLDIDRLAEAARGLRLFRIGRGAPFVFRPEDHGARSKGAPLRDWAVARFGRGQIDLQGGPIRLVTFPRVLGCGFAPISLWLGYRPGGELAGVIYEVHNTFGETHAYVSSCTSPRGLSDAPKDLFVSPFFARTGNYRFTFREPAERLELIIENIDAAGRSHVASLVARRQPLTDHALAAWLVRMPFSGLGVAAAIHWQALRLWLKGAKLQPKPEPYADPVTVTAGGDKARQLEAASSDLRGRKPGAPQ